MRSILSHSCFQSYLSYLCYNNLTLKLILPNKYISIYTPIGVNLVRIMTLTSYQKHCMACHSQLDLFHNCQTRFCAKMKINILCDHPLFCQSEFQMHVQKLV